MTEGLTPEDKVSPGETLDAVLGILPDEGDISFTDKERYDAEKRLEGLFQGSSPTDLISDNTSDESDESKTQDNVTKFLKP